MVCSSSRCKPRRTNSDSAAGVMSTVDEMAALMAFLPVRNEDLLQQRSETLARRGRVHADKSTLSFRPSASAHLCKVASVGFSILPVSSRDNAGGSIPIRAATSANVNPWLLSRGLEFSDDLQDGDETLLVNGIRRPPLHGVFRMLLSNCFFVLRLLCARSGLTVGFISFTRFWDFVGDDGTNREAPRESMRCCAR